jgi:nitrogen regulatory protein P-II 1
VHKNEKLVNHRTSARADPPRTNSARSYTPETRLATLEEVSVVAYGLFMKRIEAIIRPSKLDEVKESLSEAGVKGMTVIEVKGFGRTGGRKEVYRGSAYVVDFVPKIKIEVVAPDNLVATILDVVEKAAKTGKIGDGKIFVTDILEAVRIRTGERGQEAV